MEKQARYREENGEARIDVSATSVEHLFDNRDPAPFRQRDLDPDLVEYLQDASEDLATRTSFRVVFWLDKPCDLPELEPAYRAHFTYELERLVRKRRRQRRTGLVGLAIAAAAICLVLAVTPAVSRLALGSLGRALVEALDISCWVLMWRPIDVLLYDWIPFRRERRTIARLLAAPIEVRAGPRGTP